MKNLLNAVLISLILISCRSNPKQNIEILKYQIARTQDISFGNTLRMKYIVILDVDSLPTNTEMKNTASYIWMNGNRNWNEFTVFMYLSNMDTESIAYGVGEFNQNGIVFFEKNNYALYGTKWEIKKIKEPIEPIKEIPATKLKEYKINVFAINEGERKVKINITTNFPDGTNLNIGVGREYYVKGDKEIHSGDLFDKDFSIINGKFETIIIIKDTEWYNEHQRLVRALPNDIQPITKISDKITIDVLYTAAALQPANVLEILGTRGEFVTGEGSEHFGTGTAGRLTSLRISKEFYFPFKK